MAAHVGYILSDYKDQMQLITFGSPKVGNQEFADYFNNLLPNSKR